MIELPTILVGMGKVNDNLKRFPQVSSRVSQKVRFENCSKDDVAALIKGRCEVPVAPDLVEFTHKASSGYLAGKYEQAGGRVDKLEAKIIATYSNRICCPHLGMDISQSECADCRTCSIPTSDPALLKQWIACKSCPINPAYQESEAC